MSSGATTQVTLTDATSGSTSVTNTGGTSSAGVQFRPRISIVCDNGATNNVIFTVEGSLDNSNWYTIAYREDATDSWTITSHTVGGSTNDVVFINHYDYVRWIRVNVATANANGSTFTVYAE